MKFVHIGMENIVSDAQVLLIMKYGSQPSKRLLTNAKMTAMFIDATSNKSLRSLILLNNGYVVGSMLHAKTLMSRFNSPLTDVEDPEEVEPEEIPDYL